MTKKKKKGIKKRGQEALDYIVKFYQGIGSFHRTIYKFWKGEGKISDLIINWYFMFNILMICAGFWLFNLTNQYQSIGFIGGLLCLFMVLIYPIGFLVSLWSCSCKIRKPKLRIAIRALSIPFIFIHIYLSFFYGFWSIIMISESVRYFGV